MKIRESKYLRFIRLYTRRRASHWSEEGAWWGFCFGYRVGYRAAKRRAQQHTAEGGK